MDLNNVTFSGIREIADLLSKKWRARVLYTIRSGGPYRFHELKQQFEISSKMLTTSLNELTEKGVIERRAQNESHVTYSLTEAGVRLLALTDKLNTWAEQYSSSYSSRILVVNSDPRLAQLFTDWLTPRYNVMQVTQSHQLDGDLLEEVDIVVFHYHPFGEIDPRSLQNSGSLSCDRSLVVIAPSKRKLAESGLRHCASLTIPVQTKELHLCVETVLDSSSSE